METVIYSKTQQKVFFAFNDTGQRTISVFALQALFLFQTDRHSPYSVIAFSLLCWGGTRPPPGLVIHCSNSQDSAHSHAQS